MTKSEFRKRVLDLLAAPIATLTDDERLALVRRTVTEFEKERTEGLPYLMLDRFGLANHVAVEFVVGFPLFEHGDTKWVEKVVADFNATCESLKIDGTNSTEAKVYLGKLPSKN